MVAVGVVLIGGGEIVEIDGVGVGVGTNSVDDMGVAAVPPMCTGFGKLNLG